MRSPLLLPLAALVLAAPAAAKPAAGPWGALVAPEVRRVERTSARSSWELTPTRPRAVLSVMRLVEGLSGRVVEQGEVMPGQDGTFFQFALRGLSPATEYRLVVELVALDPAWGGPGRIEMPTRWFVTAATDAAEAVAQGRPAALRASDGRYVGVDPKTGALRADRPTAEALTLVRLGEDRVALRGADGRFVGPDPKRASALFADRPAPGEAETFTMVRLSATEVALRAGSGRFVTVDTKRAAALVAARPRPGRFETFTLASP